MKQGEKPHRYRSLAWTVDVQVDVDVDVDEWSDLTLAHERLDVCRRAIEFLADAVRIVSMLSRLC